MLVKCSKCNGIHFRDNVAVGILWDKGKIIW